MPNRPSQSSRPASAGGRASLVAIGNFDGVHRGHVVVLSAAVAEAAQGALSPVVLTFDPHPAQVLGRAMAPPLTALSRKLVLLRRISPDLEVVVEPFTLELSRCSPQAFVETILVERLRARVVVVGENFRFGHDRSGDLAELERLGQKLGFAARAEAMVGDDGGPFSSSRARAALSAGDLPGVVSCLGRPHSISGVVERGDGQGRAIGFATANLAQIPEALPPHGVYAALVDREGPEGGQALARAVLNLGVRPTRTAGFSVEAHLLDFEGDLYGARLRVHLVARLREERRFAGLDELRQQIDRDLEAARALLRDRVPDPAAGGAWV